MPTKDDLAQQELITKLIPAIEAKFPEFGLELEGKVSIRPKNGVYLVGSGRKSIGRLTEAQLVGGDIEHLFLRIRSLRVDVLKPTGGMIWSEWAKPIRANQWALAKLMDRAIEELRLTERGGRPISQTKKSKGKPVPPQSFAYNVIQSPIHQEEVRQEAQEKFNRTGQPHWEARTQFSFAGSVVSVAANQVYSAYRRWQKGEIGFPSWTGPRGVPLPLRAEEFKLLSVAENPEDDQEGDRARYRKGGGFVASFEVLEGGKKGRRECYVIPKGARDWGFFRKILSGEFPHGDGKIIWDDRKRRWQIHISYKLPRRKPANSGLGILAVRRSVVNMLFLMDDSGRTFQRVQGFGSQILHIKKKYLREKAECQSRKHSQGKGARGHGKKRFDRPYRRIADKEARVVDTKLRQLASDICTVAEEHGLEILLEDFSLPWIPSTSDDSWKRLLISFPWAKAESYLKQAAEARGISLKTTTCSHDYSSCPECGSTEVIHEGTGPLDYIDCHGCGLLIQRSIVAAWHMLKSVEVDTSEVSRRCKLSSKELRILRSKAKASEAGEYEHEQPDAAE